MARHNIYIQKDNEEAWQKSSKSNFINIYLAQARINKRTEELSKKGLDKLKQIHKQIKNNDTTVAIQLGQLPTVSTKLNASTPAGSNRFA